MTGKEAIARRVKQLRPHAKFIAVSHSDEFIPVGSGLGEGFYTAYLYDERIDANMISSRLGRVMISNTYVSSFAYNLFLCWLHGHRKGIASHEIERLLAHNFKKFFAEQIYRGADRIPARALLLETLFEQAIMEEVFTAKERDAELSAHADAAAQLMSLVLSTHEFGHYLIEAKADFWAEWVAAAPPVVAIAHEQARQGQALRFVKELQCDTFALVQCLGQYEAYAGPAFALRALAFAFAAYAAMYSAAATATATARLWNAQPAEIVDFLDVAPMPAVEHEVAWEIDQSFVERAILAVDLCRRLADDRGIALFGANEPFPLSSSIVQDLLAHVGKVFDCECETARKMAALVARSMEGHTEGMEYLYLRSKTFQSRRTEKLIVEP